MTTFVRRVALAASILSLSNIALAEESPLPVFSGFVEAAYHIDFMDPSVDREQIAPLNTYTPPGNMFVLHAAHLAVAHSFNEHVSATIELDAGFDAAKTAAYPFQGSPFDVQEAYATYQTGIFAISGGKFAAWEGLEVIEGPPNPTITRGYSFNMAEPNTHTGVQVQLASETVAFAAGLVNGWDTLLDNNDAKTVIAKLAYTPSSAFTINVNGTFGAETEDVDDQQRLSLDLNGAWSPSERFELRFQANFGMDEIGAEPGTVHWYVFGLQPFYTGEVFTFGARAEFFADPDGARSDLGPVDLVNVTLTPGVRLARGFHARFELRGDLASKKVFGTADDPYQMFISAAIGADYTF